MDWKPFPKQEIALQSKAFETLFGGARGPGKTDAGIVWMIYDQDGNGGSPVLFTNALYRGLVIRKNFTDLKDWIDRAQRMYHGMGGKLVGNDFIFPSGAKIVTGHLSDANAYLKYMGHEYHRILIEELTHIPSEDSYLKLIASARSTVPGLNARVFATTNPGGPGHPWVKKRFVDPARLMQVFNDPRSGRTRVYIPGTVDDNPRLKELDPEYVRFLESLPPDQKAQWRYGSWENQKVKGAYYADDIFQAQEEQRISLLPYNPNLPVHTFWDLGLNDVQVCWFVQIVGQAFNFIDVLHDNDKGWDFYVHALKEKKYHYGIMGLPHDGTKRSADTKRSFKDTLEAENFTVIIVPRTADKQNSIDVSRKYFPSCYFDSESTAKGIEALTMYRRLWIEDRQTFDTKPYHDWTSNFADAYQCFAAAIDQGLVGTGKKDDADLYRKYAFGMLDEQDPFYFLKNPY